MWLAENFHLDEFLTSTTAAAQNIRNIPDRCAIASMRLLCLPLQTLRTHLGRSVDITSGFRTPALDRAVGGSGAGQHVLGEAADIVVDGMSSLDLARTIRALDLPFDQIIGYAETRHLHVSHRAAGGQRKQLLWCVSRAKKQFEQWPMGAP